MSVKCFVCQKEVKEGMMVASRMGVLHPLPAHDFCLDRPELGGYTSGVSWFQALIQTISLMIILIGFTFFVQGLEPLLFLIVILFLWSGYTIFALVELKQKVAD